MKIKMKVLVFEFSAPELFNKISLSPRYSQLQYKEYQALNSATNLKSPKKRFEKCPIRVTIGTFKRCLFFFTERFNFQLPLRMKFLG